MPKTNQISEYDWEVAYSDVRISGRTMTATWCKGKPVERVTKWELCKKPKVVEDYFIENWGDGSETKTLFYTEEITVKVEGRLYRRVYTRCKKYWR